MYAFSCLIIFDSSTTISPVPIVYLSWSPRIALHPIMLAAFIIISFVHSTGSLLRYANPQTQCAAVRTSLVLTSVPEHPISVKLTIHGFECGFTSQEFGPPTFEYFSTQSKPKFYHLELPSSKSMISCPEKRTVLFICNK